MKNAGLTRSLLLIAGITFASYCIASKLSSAPSAGFGAASSHDIDSPSYLPYLEWYHGITGTAAKVFFVVALVLWLLFLFSFIGIVASDFFCPNLSTISSKLGLSESVAGSTLLAFGNGSPDVFSTFASLSANSGSLAIGELLGAAAFIVSVVAGVMTLVKPFKVARHSFLRDVGFFTIAVALILAILWDKTITKFEAAGMIVLYVGYVVAVVLTSWWHGRKERISEALRRAREQYAAEEEISGVLATPHEIEPYTDNPSESASRATSTHTSPRYKQMIYSPMEDEEIINRTERSSPLTITTSGAYNRRRASSISATPTAMRHHHKTSVRQSLLGAIEFRDVVNSLAENSSANSLAIFGPLDSPNVSNLDDHRRARSPIVRPNANGRSFSHLPSAAYDEESLSRPPHRRAASTTQLPTTEEAPEFDPAIWENERQATPNKNGRVDLIDLSTGVDDPWQSTSTSPLRPRQLLNLNTNIEPAMLANSPAPMTDSEQPPSKTVRKVPSIMLVNESGQVTPVTLLSPPDTPTGVQVPKWIVKSGKRRRQIKYLLRSLRGALFPSLAAFRQKSIVSGFLAVISAPAIFVLIMTLPVVDDEAEESLLDFEEKEYANISHHYQTAQLPAEPEYTGDDEEEHEGWQERARRRNEHIAHVLHSPAAFRHSGPSQDSYVTPIDLSRVDAGLKSQLNGIPTDNNVEVQINRQYLPSGGISPPASVKEDVDQNAMDDRVANIVVMTECMLSPFFVLLALFGDELKGWYFLVAGGVAVFFSLIASAILAHPRKRGKIFLCLIGFVVSMVWLLSCVNEVVGVLQAIGHVFGLSDAILGVTVFALGNSTADLVANYTIAKMGYPVMAIAACYGGPLLNILLGVGISGSYFIAKNGEPYHIDFDTTLITTCLSLLFLLITTLIFIPWNGYQMTRKWGVFLILFYLALTLMNLIVEIRREKSEDEL